MKRLMVYLVVVLGLGTAEAATLQADADVRAFADRVMAKVAKADLPGAFAEMKPYTIIPPTEFDAAALQSKSQRDLVGTRFGATIGYEFISEKRSGQSLLKLTYIEMTERHAIPWIFYFYRTPNGWVLNSFFWHDRMTDLLTGQ